MNEWKEIVLPANEYEWELSVDRDLDGPYFSGDYGLTKVWKSDINNITIRYRRKGKTSPTHEEIMTKWWNDDKQWYKVELYSPCEEHPYKIESYGWVKKTWFDECESADIPPEE